MKNLQDQLNAPSLSNTARRQVVAMGHACIPELLQILANEDQWGPDEDAEGWAAVHAATLLGQLKATDAIEPLLDVLSEVELDTELATEVMGALSAMGPAVIDPVLQRYRANQDEDVHLGCAEILARSGVKDERILERLCAELDIDVAFGAALLRTYGDTSVVPLLADKLNALSKDACDDEVLRAFAVIEVCAALEALRGALTAEELPQQEAARTFVEALPEMDDMEADELPSVPVAPEPFKWRGSASWHVHTASCNHGPQMPHTRKVQKIGPNEICHCGSGKKYKKCHLFEDERNRLGPRRSSINARPAMGESTDLHASNIRKTASP